MFITVFNDGQKEIDQDIEDVGGNGGSDEDQITGILNHKCYISCHQMEEADFKPPRIS